MIAAQTNLSPDASLDPGSTFSLQSIQFDDKKLSTAKSALLPKKLLTHQPKAGLNLIVDAASYLFSVLGKIQLQEWVKPIPELHQELIYEMHRLFEYIKNQGYSIEYTSACLYLLAATVDDIIPKHLKLKREEWQPYALLSSFKEKNNNIFFNIIEQAIKAPDHYIDLLELGFICLTLGYQGESAANHPIAEQTTDQVYKHIRAYRGNISKMLSPVIFKSPKRPRLTKPTSMSFSTLFFFTACLIMIIFVSLGYLMDIIANDAYHFYQTPTVANSKNPR